MAKVKEKAAKKSKAGRKLVNFDWEKVNFYLQAGCDGAAIARLLGHHPDTLYNAIKRVYKSDFSAYQETKRAEGVALMEGTIFKDAIERGGVDRMFWLKNRAKWADKQEVDHTTKGDKITDMNITVDSSETAKQLKELINGTKESPRDKGKA